MILYKRAREPMKLDGETFNPDWSTWTARRLSKAQLAFLIECRMGKINGSQAALTRGNLMTVRNLVANGLLRIDGGWLGVTEAGKVRADAEFERTQ